MYGVLGLTELIRLSDNFTIRILVISLEFVSLNIKKKFSKEMTSKKLNDNIPLELAISNKQEI